MRHSYFVCFFFFFFLQESKVFFQDGINLIFYHGLSFCGNPWTCGRPLKVDTGVLRFVLELTEIRWLYRLLGIRKWMFWLDRFFDFIPAWILFISNFDCFYYDPLCNIFPGIYITLRVISLALCYNTKLWKCYKVRTVLSIVFGLFCMITVVCLYLFNKGEEIRYTAPVIGVTSMCALYVLPLVWKDKLLQMGDAVDQLPPELRDNCWFYRYHLTRKVLMYAYGLCIFVALFAFQAYGLILLLSGMYASVSTSHSS